jgi:hypothetical protein
MSTLENYQIRFFQDRHGKALSSRNDWLTCFITGYESSLSLTCLINACDYALNGGDEMNIMEACDLYIADIGPLTTKIFKDIDVWGAGGAEPDFELPTTDFKEIVLAWKDYFESESENEPLETSKRVSAIQSEPNKPFLSRLLSIFKNGKNKSS